MLRVNNNAKRGSVRKRYNGESIVRVTLTKGYRLEQPHDPENWDNMGIKDELPLEIKRHCPVLLMCVVGILSTFPLIGKYYRR